MTQFVACKFRTTDARSYTYRNDGEPVAVGDRVIVETSRGEQTVTVAEVTDQAPPFACKPVLGKSPPKELSLEPAPAAGGDPLGDDIAI